MRGFLVALIFLAQNAQAGTFLDRCFPKTNFLKTQIDCRLSDESGELVFSLKQSKTITVVGSGQYGTMNKTFNVEKITHLPPRLSDVGALDESVRFLGTKRFNGYTVTIAIPCNQTAFGTVGLSKKLEDDELPSEHIASCVAQ